MSVRHAPSNAFLTVAVRRLFVTTAIPIVVVMLMSGLLSVIDAAMLGIFVGADAVAAVSLVFPAVMLTIAVSTLVGSGMSSHYARYLGAGDQHAAAEVFASAQWLALALASILVLANALFGSAITMSAAGNNEHVAGMSQAFLTVTIIATPLQFLLGLHVDALRNEGKSAFLAPLSIGMTLGNIVLNGITIVVLDLGVAGSALGSATTQGIALVVLVLARRRKQGSVSEHFARHSWIAGWGRIIASGAPLSLSFVGLAVVSTSVIAAIQTHADNGSLTTVTAYGIILRLFGFAYLPLMGMALAMQAIVGNNVGAGLFARSDQALKIAIVAAVAYCAAIEATMLGLASEIGRIFVDDPLVIADVGRILPMMAVFYFMTGPVLIFALYFQSIGRPRQAALLTLLKPFGIQPALILLLSHTFGEPGIWMALPLADLSVACVAIVLFVTVRRRITPGLGLLRHEAGA